MIWNYLKLVLERSWEEVLLLVLALLWVLLRMLQVVERRLEKGKPLSVHLFGKELIEVKGINGADTLRTLRARGKTRRIDGLEERKTEEPISFSQMVEPVLSRKSQLNLHTSEKEVGIKNGSRRI